MTGTAAPAAAPGTRRGGTPLVLAGAVCGLAWAAALRALMAEFAGPESTFDWFGTFEGILLPGAVAGGLLGWAEHLRRTGRRRTWLAAAPLVFVLATPWVVASVFVDGLGGGAIAVPLLGMAGGYALAGRGPRWARWAAGGFALLPVPAWFVAASLVGGRLALDTPRGAWIAVLFLSLLAVLALACTIPHRAPAELLGSRRRLVLVGVVGGLAWGAGMRAFMAAVAEPVSEVSWLGTFGIILPAGAVVGGLLGWADHLRRTGGLHGRRRRLTLAPLAFTVDPASLVVTLPAMAGGYALAGRGSRRARWATGVSAFLPVPLFLLAVTFLDDIRELATPRGAWTVVLLFSHLAVLTLACAVPHRALVPSTGSTVLGSRSGRPSGRRRTAPHQALVRGRSGGGNPQPDTLCTSRPSVGTSSRWSAGTTAEWTAVQQPGQQYWRKTIGAST